MPKNQHTQKKLLNFENWRNGEVSKSVKKCQNLTLKSIFYVKNHLNLSQFLFYIEKYQLRSTFFFIDILDNLIFRITLLLKWCQIFDSSPLHQFSEFMNFVWVKTYPKRMLTVIKELTLSLNRKLYEVISGKNLGLILI